ncbi:group III truncated hemoglobin [Chitinivorax sp. PXF-14]|uniref:group III truncated hemoglobin n=1 Tax=Chitinivorax sp. PXF-14 TaxID=3230488 RepID=UPI003465AD96
MQDIAELIGHDAVAHVVDRFYDRIQQHPSLGPVFSVVDDWPEHKARLTLFWWVTLGGARYRDYRYSVAERHMEAGFTPALLGDWLALFRDTIEATLPAEQAAPWLARAERIGESLVLMHEHMQGQMPAER